MNRHPRALLAVIVSMVLLAGATAAIGQTSGGSPLTANPWTLVSLDGAAVPASAGVTATFTDDGKLTGSGGCNNFTATYTAEGDELKIENLLAGIKSCAEPAHDQERTFFEYLEGADTFSIDEGTLTITTDEGPTMELAAPGGLVGAWALSSINGTPIPDTVSATAVFGDDGTLTGSGGCHEFNTTYTVDGGAIAMGELWVTRRACATILMSVETTYLDELQVATQFAVSGATLILTDATGAVKLELTLTGAVTPTPVPAGSQEPPGTQQPSGTIVGPTWRLTDFAGAPLGGLFTVTAVFGADGIMSGNGGCNDYTADYTLTGDRLAVTNVDIGAGACPGTGGTIEQTYISVLPLVDSLTLQGAKLVMESTLYGVKFTFEVMP